MVDLFAHQLSLVLISHGGMARLSRPLWLVLRLKCRVGNHMLRIVHSTWQSDWNLQFMTYVLFCLWGHFSLFDFKDFNFYRKKVKIRLDRDSLTSLHTTHHNTMKPNIPVLDWMFSSSSSFVHLQNKQKQTFASDQLANAVSTLMRDIDIAILSVCPWGSGIRWKRLNILSQFSTIR